MARRELTPDQIAARDARREKIRGITRTLAKMTPAELEALAAKYPVITVEGRTLSIHNQCLIVSQADRPITIVGGFRQWRQNGRYVRKGEHGLAIWFPSRKQERAEAAPNGTGEVDETRFYLGTVFDVTQTDESES